ncbi:MAG: hypothetical protein AAF708_14600 [Deinococcota bacterium]
MKRAQQRVWNRYCLEHFGLPYHDCTSRQQQRARQRSDSLSTTRKPAKQRFGKAYKAG